MSEWAWVALGYGVAYGALGSYVAVLVGRRVRMRRRIRDLP